MPAPKKPGSFQLRVLHVLQRAGTATCREIWGELRAHARSIDQVERSLNSLLKHGYVNEFFPGAVAHYSLTDKSAAATEGDDDE